MARPSKIKPEDWDGPIRDAYETDGRPHALNVLGAEWGLTARRIRQVGVARGWVRAPEVLLGQDGPVREAVKNAPKVRRPRKLDATRGVESLSLPGATPEMLAAAGADTHRNAPPAPEKKKSKHKVRDQIQAAQEDASRNLDIRSPPGARAAAYAAVALDPTMALETYRQMVTQQVERTVALGNIFNLMTGLIQTVVAPVDPNDAEGQQRRADATMSLFPGRTDSLAGVLTATRQLAEVLRAHEAGMMDVHVEAARRRAAQEIEAREEGGGASKTDDDIAFELLPVEEQLRLMEAALLLDGNRIAPDFPVPPTGPVIEHPPLAPNEPEAPSPT